jgi:raffinose/stachyose/melibiose transport system permease protein
MKIKQHIHFILEIILVTVVFLCYAAPFYFILVNSVKDEKSAGLLKADWPTSFHLVENFKEVLTTQDYAVVRGFLNSFIITFISMVVIVIICSMAGYVMQRRSGKGMTIINFCLLTGLMLPPSIITTIWVMRILGIYGTLFGMILIEIAINIPFSTVLYRSYMGTVPKEIEEAAFIDGCGKFGMFFRIILPLLAPVTATVVALISVVIFNDFTNPLYFLPGASNVTVQLMLISFMGEYYNSWNLLFADVVLVTIPPFLLFLVCRKQMVAGLTAGAVKG